jgi:D-alanyl-D-alanine carboxypeptidase (penicillin-binding protein 5/6)
MKAFGIFFLIALSAAGAGAAPFQSAARSFFLMDYQSGQVLAAKDEDELMAPSSMIKLMTAELAFGALRSGRLALGDKLVASRNADYRNPVLGGATKVCLSEGQAITAEDALAALIAVSAGDAAIILAENLAGSETAFAEKMTARAREIGMEYSSFANASGLPDPENLSTSRELAMLGSHILREYPEYAHLFKMRRFEFVNPLSDFCRSWVKSHTISYNKLLFMMGGAEGMKTGHTVRGGYGIVAAASRKGRRLIAVINGMNAKNHDALAAEAKRLLEYGFEATYNKEIKSDVQAPLWYGKKAYVKASAKERFVLTFKSDAAEGGLRVTALVPEKIAAPVAAGDVIGKIIATINGAEVKSADLIASESIGRVRFFGRMWRNIKYFLTGG